MNRRLIIYGDSILRGITFVPELGRHRLCRGYKLPTITAAGYEVINHARMGATVTRGMDLLGASLTEELSRDSIVLLEYGGNDCDYDWEKISAAPDGTHLPHTPEEHFLSVYGHAIETARARGAHVILSSLVPINAERYLSVISRDRSRENILHWLGDTSMLYRFHEHYNELVHTLAHTYGCPLIDVREQFLLSHRYSHLISEDGIHPTEEGHDMIESAILTQLSCMSRSCA